MITVEIFSKPDCHLCDLVKDTVLKVKNKVDFRLIEVDITSDPSLETRYGLEVPVIYINGRKAFKYRVSEQEFMLRLTRTFHEQPL